MPVSEKIVSSTIICRSRDISFSQLDDELLAIDAQAGYCYAFNETAGKIWDIIVVPTSIDQICCQLRRQYSVDEGTCLSQMILFVQKLYDAGLVDKA